MKKMCQSVINIDFIRKIFLDGLTNFIRVLVRNISFSGPISFLFHKVFNSIKSD